MCIFVYFYILAEHQINRISWEKLLDRKMSEGTLHSGCSLDESEKNFK